MRIAVRTDASPYGFGGILFEKGVPVAWVAGNWEKDDFSLLAAKRGDPTWQAESELDAALLAIDTWLPRLRDQPLGLFQAGSTAALYWR